MLGIDPKKIGVHDTPYISPLISLAFYPGGVHDSYYEQVGLRERPPNGLSGLSGAVLVLA